MVSLEFTRGNAIDVREGSSQGVVSTHKVRSLPSCRALEKCGEADSHSGLTPDKTRPDAALTNDRLRVGASIPTGTSVLVKGPACSTVSAGAPYRRETYWVEQGETAHLQAALLHDIVRAQIRTAQQDSIHCAWCQDDHWDGHELACCRSNLFNASGRPAASQIAAASFASFLPPRPCRR